MPKNLIIIFILAALPMMAQNVDSLNTEIAKCDNDSIKIKLMLDVVYVYQYRTPNYSKAKEYYDKALKLATSHKWKWAIYRCYRSQGSWGSLKGDYNNAYDYDMLALQIASEYDSVKISTTYLDLSDDFIGLGNYGMAWHMLQRAEPGLDTLNKIRAVLNLGIIYAELDKTDDAIDKFIQTHKMASAIKDYEGMAFADLELGDTYIEIGRHDLAKRHLNRALVTARKHDFNWLIPEHMFKMGKLNILGKDFPKAKAYLDSSMLLFRVNYNQYGQISTMLGWIYIAIEQNQFDAAQMLLEEAMSMANGVNAARLKIKILRAYAKMYEKKGDYESALEWSWKRGDAILLASQENLYDEINTRYEYGEIKVIKPTIANPKRDAILNTVDSLLSFWPIYFAIALAFMFWLGKKSVKRINTEI